VFFLKRFIPIITPLLVFLTLEFFYLKPDFIYFFILALLIIISAGTWRIIGKGLVTLEARWFYLLTPLSFIVSGLLFILFIENFFAKHLLTLALSLFWGIFLENIYTYIYRHEKYQINSLENISNYLNLSSVFFLNSSLFGFFIFLNTPLWQLSLISLFASLVLTFQIIWVNKIKPSVALLHLVVICLVLFETFWTVSFLPTAYFVNGLIVTIIFYFLNNIMRLRLTGRLSKMLVRRYIILCGLIMIVLLVTAKWI